MDKKEIIELLKVNSKGMSNLFEQTSASDLVDTETLVGSVIEVATNTSVIAQAFNVQPVTSPAGAVFGAKTETEDIEVLSSQVSAASTVNQHRSASETEVAITGLAALNWQIGDKVREWTDDSTPAAVYGEIVSFPTGRMRLKNIQGTFVVGQTWKKIVSSTETSKVSVKKSDVVLHTNKTKIDITQEALQDIISIYGNEDALNQIVGSDLTRGADITGIKYARSIASKQAPFEISSAYATSNGLRELFHSIMVRVLVESSQMNLTMKRGFHPVIICSPTIAAGLASIGQVQSDKNNSNFVAIVNGVEVYQDPNFGLTNPHDLDRDASAENYVLVSFKSERIGDSGIIYSPYQTYFKFITQEDTGDAILHAFTRDAFIRNPLDNGTGADDSEYLREFLVTGTLPNLEL